MKQKKIVQYALIIILASTLTNCASNYPARFKIHSEPEGAHIIYREGASEWVYLGSTPLEVTRTINKDLSDETPIAMRTMRTGYLDQTKEWHTGQLKKEMEQKKLILWTPRLIKNVE